MSTFYILPDSKDLKHHGIDGQKWGVRNGPPYPLDKGKRFKDRLTYSGLKKQEKGINEPHYLKKGTKIYRTTSSKIENNSGSVYVSYTDVDKNIYREWVRQTEAKSGKDVYDKTFKLTNDLKICGTDQLKDAFSEVIKKIGDKSLDTAARDFIIGDRVANKDINQAKKDAEEVEKFNKSLRNPKCEFEETTSSKYPYYTLIDRETHKKIFQISVDTYDNGCAYKQSKSLLDCIIEEHKSGKITDFEYGVAAMTKNPKLKNALTNSLKSKGFDAMPDLAGAGIMPNHKGDGYTREGVEPLIIFDRSNLLKEIKTEEVNPTKSYENYRLYGRRALNSLGYRKRN